MQIAIQVNLTRPHAFDVTTQVIRELDALGATVLMERDMLPSFGGQPVRFLEPETAWAQCDLFIAIGGDGTFIHAAHDAARYDKEILGINAGSLGFLAGLEKTELPLLRNLIDGNYEIDKRMMLCVEHYRGGQLQEKFYCLNDAVFARGLSMRMCDITVDCDGKRVNDYFADGLIFATPTGSTAYSLSAGGPVLMPDSASFVVTPMNPHALGIRPIVLSDEVAITVTTRSRDEGRGGRIGVYADGENAIMLDDDGTVEIRRAPERALMVELDGYSPYEVLSRKLGWTDARVRLPARGGIGIISRNGQEN